MADLAPNPTFCTDFLNACNTLGIGRWYNRQQFDANGNIIGVLWPAYFVITFQEWHSIPNLRQLLPPIGRFYVGTSRANGASGEYYFLEKDQFGTITPKIQQWVDGCTGCA